MATRLNEIFAVLVETLEDLSNSRFNLKIIQISKNELFFYICKDANHSGNPRKRVNCSS